MSVSFRFRSDNGILNSVYHVREDDAFLWKFSITPTAQTHLKKIGYTPFWSCVFFYSFFGRLETTVTTWTFSILVLLLVRASAEISILRVKIEFWILRIVTYAIWCWHYLSTVNRLVNKKFETCFSEILTFFFNLFIYTFVE